MSATTLEPTITNTTTTETASSGIDTLTPKSHHDASATVEEALSSTASSSNSDTSSNADEDEEDDNVASLSSRSSNSNSTTGATITSLNSAPKSILVNTDKHLPSTIGAISPEDNRGGLFYYMAHKVPAAISRAHSTSPSRNPAYQRGTVFMKDAPPPKRESISSESGIHFAPLPPGKPRTTSFTLGVSARRDILRGVISGPDSRNPATQTLNHPPPKQRNPVPNSGWRDPQVAAESPDAYTYKDIAPAFKNMVNKLHRPHSHSHLSHQVDAASEEKVAKSNSTTTVSTTPTTTTSTPAITTNKNINHGMYLEGSAIDDVEEEGQNQGYQHRKMSL